METIREKHTNVSVGQIIEKFWQSTGRYKPWFLVAFIFFLLAQVATVIVPIFYKSFFDILGSHPDKTEAVKSLMRIIEIVLILRLTNWLSWRIAINIYQNMQARVMALIKQTSFDYLTSHSYSFFANTFGGSLVQRLNRFSRAFEAITDNITFSLLPLFVTIIGSMIAVYRFAPLLSGVLAIWIVAFGVFSVSFSRWKMKYDLISSEADSVTTGYLADVITNNSSVSFFTGHEYESIGFREVTDDQTKKTLYSWKLGDITDAVQMFLLILVEFFIFYYAIKFWSQGLITVGTFVLVQTYIISLSGQLWGLGKIVRNLYQNIAESKEMVEILDTPHEIRDLPGAKPIKIESGQIEFDNVTFGFSKDSKIINDFNLKIKGGEKVAIVGPSGSGKTTLVRLIMRVYDVGKGAVKIDGQNIKDITQSSLRESISFVPQDPVLFHRTLMDNIRYGRRHATDQDVIAAAKLAHCDEFIDKLPLGYQTYVGERGIKLSGGERQRVAIARAILKHAPILIFDEATSSLDSYSEHLIQDALENLMKNCTTIVIAHRLSTIKKMDRIISMREGQIVEEGTHDELTSKESGLYKKLWDLQSGGFL